MIHTLISTMSKEYIRNTALLNGVHPMGWTNSTSPLSLFAASFSRESVLVTMQEYWNFTSEECNLRDVHFNFDKFKLNRRSS